MISVLTWELIPQTPSRLSSESRQQTPHWSSASAIAQRFPVEETCTSGTSPPRHTQLYRGRAHMMFDLHIVPSCEHWAASSLAASSPLDQSWTRARWTCVDHRPHYDNWHRQHSFDWRFIFWSSVPLTCSPELWLWIRTQIFWTAWPRRRLHPRPRTASWWSHRVTTDQVTAERKWKWCDGYKDFVEKA